MKYLFYIAITCLFSCNKGETNKEIEKLPQQQEVLSKIPGHNPPGGIMKKIAEEMNFVTYTVQPGDTFSEICQIITGNGTTENYQFHAKRNGLENPNYIFPGKSFYFIIDGKKLQALTVKCMTYQLLTNRTSPGDFKIFPEWITVHDGLLSGDVIIEESEEDYSGLFY